VEDERLRFVARLLDGEKMARVCAEFGISRKTGCKIFDRYQEVGLRGLTDRSRRPYRHANQLPIVVEKTIVRLKREYPNWGRRGSGSAYGSGVRTCSVRPSGRFARCSTAMAW
jgi:hypothetical protein